MKQNKENRLSLNAGTGMVSGILIAALIAVIVSSITGEQAIWAWAIPVGLAVGLAIGAGHAQQTQEE